MELKSGLQRSGREEKVSFNRTFMELKCLFGAILSKLLIVLIVPLWNWNTVLLLAFIDVFLVLIVPLWNWNSQKSLANLSYSFCFNRTFMELK